MKISIHINGKKLSASVLDNEAAAEFVSLLPLSFSMKDLFGREKYAPLPRPLKAKALVKNTYSVGDICYWAPTHDLAIYYLHDGETIPSPGIIPIARIDKGAENFNVPGEVTVTIKVAD
jgi:hypothetical protein